MAPSDPEPAYTLTDEEERTIALGCIADALPDLTTMLERIAKALEAIERKM